MPTPLATTPGQPSDAVQQARAKAERLASAFEHVFGSLARRSEDQQIVLSHLATCAGDDANSYRFNEARDGLALIAAGIHRDGARSILRIIERQVEIAAKKRDAKPGKVKTIR